VVLLERAWRDAVRLEDRGVAETVEVSEVGGVVLVMLLHRRVEAVTADAESLAEDGRLERLWREVTLHLADVFLPEELQVLEGGILLVVHGDRPHLVQRAVEPFQIVFEIGRNGLALAAELADALLRLPDLVDGALDGLDELLVHLLPIVQEPRALCGLRHIGEDHHRVVERVMAEERAYAAVCRQRLILQLVVVDELCLVDEEPGERERVAGSRSVLRDDDGAGTVVKCDDVLIVRWLGDGFLERLRRFAANDIVDAIDVAPPFPRGEEPGKRVRQTMFEGRHDDASRGARHALHVAEHEGRGDGVGLAGASACYDDGGAGGDQLSEKLGFVEVDRRTSGLTPQASSLLPLSKGRGVERLLGFAPLATLGCWLLGLLHRL